MATTLNGHKLFDERSLVFELGSIDRDSIDRSIAGLDGMMAIDLGQRGRVIKQTGTLRAKSYAKLDERIGNIADHMDGYAYTLVTNDRRHFDNVRIDAFKTSNRRISGASVMADYEIVYIQLLVD